MGSRPGDRILPSAVLLAVETGRRLYRAGHDGDDDAPIEVRRSIALALSLPSLRGRPA